MRHADTDLALTLEDGAVEDRAESDAGEEQRDGGEECGEHGEQALANGLIAEQVELRGDVRDAKAVAELRDELAEGVGEDERVLGVGVNGERGDTPRNLRTESRSGQRLSWGEAPVRGEPPGKRKLRRPASI
jgi:hypothetical protein